MHLIWSDQAIKQLREIHTYIAIDSPANAPLVAELILQSVYLIADFPQLGRRIGNRNKRSYAVPDTGFLIYYAIEKHAVHLTAIRRGKRDRLD